MLTPARLFTLLHLTTSSIVPRPISPFPGQLPPDHPLANVASPNRLVANPAPTASTRYRSPAPSSNTRTRQPPYRTPRPHASIGHTPRPPSENSSSLIAVFVHPPRGDGEGPGVPGDAAVDREGAGAPGVVQDRPGATAPEPPRPHASLIAAARRPRC